MQNAIFVHHPVSFLPHCCPPPALACRRCSTPLSSVTIVVRGSHRKPPQSSLPIRCLRRLSLLSLIAVVSRWRPPSFQFTAVAAAAMGVGGHRDGRRRQRWHDRGGRRQRLQRRNGRRDGGAITMRGIETVAVGGGGDGQW